MNARELATILAALRYWQRYGLTRRRRSEWERANMPSLQLPSWAEYDLATDQGDFDALSDTEIDTLCERLNAGEPIVLASIPANTSAADMLAATRFIDPEAKQPSTDSEAIACLREVMDFWKLSTDDEMPRELFDRANRLIGAESGDGA